MDNKIKLFLDFDETITLSTKQFVKIANKKFNLNKDWKKLKSWNFTDLYPMITTEDINKIFCSEDFFVDLELHNNALNTILDIKDNIELHIATIGLKENLNKKEKWLNNNLNGIKFIFDGILDNNKCDKSSIDMSNSIFIDDRIDNLISSNAKLKILYKNYRDYKWQKIDYKEEVYVVNSWEEIYKILYFFINHKEMI